MQTNQFLPQKGNYQNLIVYQKTECIYDITFYFLTTFWQRTTERLTKWCKQLARGNKI